jgi:hypothetical protein
MIAILGENLRSDATIVLVFLLISLGSVDGWALKVPG